MLKTNFHTHTARCRHAVGTDDAYAQAALAHGFHTLGFADHTPWPYDREMENNVRMDVRELPMYVFSLLHLRDRYRGKLEIQIGLECEYFEEYLPWLREQLASQALDYIIFGNHYAAPGAPYFGRYACNKEMLQRYVESSLRGMECRDFAYFAHPDLFMRAYARFDGECEKASRAICERAAKLGVVLEYNLSGIAIGAAHGDAECYPHDAFWRIAADCGCTCIIGFDAHSPDALGLDREWKNAVSKLKKLGIKRLESLDL